MNERNFGVEKHLANGKFKVSRSKNIRYKI